MSVISLYLNLKIWDNIKIGDPSFNKTQFNWLVFIYFLLNYTKPPDFLINKREKKNEEKSNKSYNITNWKYNPISSFILQILFYFVNLSGKAKFATYFFFRLDLLRRLVCIYVYRKRWFFVFSFLVVRKLHKIIWII